jgi:23S rRNA pseudouridine2605 synthase
MPAKMRKIGLARALSKLGFCSRAQAADLVRAGRVQLNGRVRHDPESPTAERDRILVDGKPASAPARVYIMLNKPRGLVTTRADEKGRPTVYDCLHDAPLPWLAPVGRLDQASEGLLLLTNDSEWAARIADPAEHLDKTYHVQINRLADAALPAQLERGIEARVAQPPSAVRLRAKSARLLRHGDKNSWLEIVLDEGRNRHIRRMLAACDVEVLRLVRVAIGPLQLGNLPKGQWRELTETEKRAIDRALQRRTADLHG